MRIVILVKYHTFFVSKIRKDVANAVVIGTVRVNLLIGTNEFGYVVEHADCTKIYYAQ